MMMLPHAGMIHANFQAALCPLAAAGPAENAFINAAPFEGFVRKRSCESGGNGPDEAKGKACAINDDSLSRRTRQSRVFAPDMPCIGCGCVRFSRVGVGVAEHGTPILGFVYRGWTTTMAAARHALVHILVSLKLCVDSKSGAYFL